MCESSEAAAAPASKAPSARGPSLSLEDLAPFAEFLLDMPEFRRTAAGFIGYGAVRSGDRVLVGVDTQYDMDVVDAVCRAFRGRGARVDLIVTEAEPDREFDELDEIRASIRRRHWAEEPRRWEGIQWIEDLAASGGYDLLVHGKGGPIPATPFRYEAIPWLSREQFGGRSTLMPPDLHMLINEKAWRLYWETGRGGYLRLTDPEGTDLQYGLPEAYYDKQEWPMFNQPWWGHLMCHPCTPVLDGADAEGIVAGTTSHFSRPYPRVRVLVSGGRVSAIEGGGGYGEGWRELEQETTATQYPLVPRPGLFWLVEVALGTNPKVRRPSDIRRLSSGGTEWDRNRSGVVHIGFGTMWRSPAEVWAIKQRVAYGHLHVHLLLPTIEVTSPGGETVTLVDRGHLTVLDDPEVRELAERHGDPDDWLREDWIPEIPGLTAAGEYDDYARDPARFVYGPAATA